MADKSLLDRAILIFFRNIATEVQIDQTYDCSDWAHALLFTIVQIGLLSVLSNQNSFYLKIEEVYSRLGMSVTTQGGSGRQYVTGSRRNISKYSFVLLNVYSFRET